MSVVRDSTISWIRRRLDARIAGSGPDQRSTTEQLRDLRDVANVLGLYDAADVITEQLKDAQ